VVSQHCTVLMKVISSYHAWDKYYKTIFVRNLQIFVIS
jgi:hypothetical protein